MSIIKTIQEEHKPWAQYNFGDRPSWQPLLGMGEELGEIFHSYLKRTQGIRNNEDHNAKIRDGVGDLIVFLVDFCNLENIDLEAEVTKVWAEVKQRDWKKNNGVL